MQEFTDYCFDSRLVNDGELFVAVKSDRGDGHYFIQDAVRGGAVAVLCERIPSNLAEDITCIVVDDTRRALVDWARYRLKSWGGTIIAVTGSIEKTSTKEAIAAVLGAKHNVFRNLRSYNGLYGLPIALGRLLDDHEIAVLELGSDHSGEIAQLAKVIQPSIAVITAVSAVHLDGLGDLDGVSSEMSDLVRAVSPNGMVVLNGDYTRVVAMSDYAKARVVTAGMKPEWDLYADSIREGLAGTDFTLHWQGRSDSFFTPWLCKDRLFSALSAIAIGNEFGIRLEDIKTAISALPTIPGRFNALSAVNGATLLDDSYNSSPKAATCALGFLDRNSEGRRKLAVLGDMDQLGARSKEEHYKVGVFAASVLDQLVVKGDIAEDIARGARESGFDENCIHYAYSSDHVVRILNEDVLLPRLNENDIVLVKGSASTRLERVSRNLLAERKRDTGHLARQHPVIGEVISSLPGRPTWVEIDVEAAANNTRQVRNMLDDNVELMVVLKADAYGHGATRLARVVLDNGASRIGLASLNEAILLRDQSIKAPILILGYSPAWTARQAILNDVNVTVYDIDIAKAFDRAAHELSVSLNVHVKVDTGMGRLGVAPEDAVCFIDQLSHLTNIKVEGLFTHFPVADSIKLEHREYTSMQIDRFHALVMDLEAVNLRPPIVHCANSAAILTRKDSHFDMVRLGILFYGLDPSPQIVAPDSFMPIMSFKTSVAQVKSMPGGTPISYGQIYKTDSDKRIAVIPVGYADGFRRSPRNWGHVLVRGQLAPIVGRVTMDQSMIDVSHIPGTRIGDEVTLIGAQGDQRIRAEDVAEKLGTINYEVVSAILTRVPRIT
ncbi:MAG: alanine racemase [Chloroflexota bacterium]